MKEKSTFTSKKITSKTIKRKTPTKSKTSNIKKNKSEKDNSIFANQEIKQDLQSFYNTEAKKYAETRKKFWHEEKAILDAITPLFTTPSASLLPITGEKNLPLCEERGTACGGEVVKKIRVLEFWCWSGRFATLLNQQFPWQFSYVGIDLSEELLTYASKENPNLTFLQWDITRFITNFEQESFDLIVWTSSFQHIPTTKERSFLMKHFYRLLDYDGMLLMTNWSLSDWFIKKNWKIVLKSRILSWFKFDKWSARDLMVPRTDNQWKVYERFYHFFSLKELERLAIFSGLTIKTNTYINENGEFTDDEKVSRSSLFIAEKNPIINQ